MMRTIAARHLMKALLQSRFNQNLARVNNLADIYESKLAPVAQGRKPVGSTDILRAAVVFLLPPLKSSSEAFSIGVFPIKPRQRSIAFR